jgi:hypothetical protein
MTALPPLELVAGVLRLVPQEFYATLLANSSSSSSSSSSGGNVCCQGVPYSWEEVQPDGAGGWTTVDGGRSGSPDLNPAYEVNGNCIDPETIVRMRPGVDGEYLFEQCCSPCNPVPPPCNLDDLLGQTFDLTWDGFQEAWVNQEQNIKLWCEDDEWLLSVCEQGAYPPDEFNCGGFLLSFNCVTSGCCPGTLGAIVTGESSSSSSSSSSGSGDCVCTEEPCYQVTIAGVTDNNCEVCDYYNDTFQLLKLADCYYSLTLPEGAACGGFGITNDPIIIEFNAHPGVLNVRIFGTASGGALVLWESSETDWDCSEPLVLTRSTPSSDFDGDCSNWPATVTVEICD